MRVLLTGASGQLGFELYRAFRLSHQVLPLAQTPHPALPDALEVDLGDTAAVKKILQTLQPELILNAAAWTDVDGAETHAAAAAALNVRLPIELASHAADSGALLLHYSTDYVFSGSGDGAYAEADPADPRSVYGQTKYAGEQQLLQGIAAGDLRALILRTSWLYSSRRKNFLLTMVKRILSGQPLKVVDDQLGCPTWARDVADCSLQAVSRLDHKNNATTLGLYHLAGSDTASWYQFAVHIGEQLLQLGRLDRLPDIKPISSTEFPAAAARPANSRLDSSHFARTFNCQPAGWDALRLCMQELAHNDHWDD